MFDVIAEFEGSSWSSDGTPVKFNGSFAYDSKDGLKVDNMSEFGKMVEPEFLMKFTKVEALE